MGREMGRDAAQVFPNPPPFWIPWSHLLVPLRPVAPMNSVLSLPAILPDGDSSGMSPFQATPLACPVLSLRDLAQWRQIHSAGFMPTQLWQEGLGLDSVTSGWGNR